MEGNIKLLSTAQIEQKLVNHAIASSIFIDILPFIQVVDITDMPDVRRSIDEVYKQKTTVIFTSSNAVYAVCETPFFSKPDWDIYCIGLATQMAVSEYFNVASIKGTAENASKLAELIVSYGSTKEAVFFCGDKRLGTLPDILASANVSLREVVVYKTEELPQFVAQHYDGILFYSPSGVNSYFGMNVPDEDIVFFAIGNTTAKAITENTINTVVVSDTPSKEKMVQIAIEYFIKRTKNK